MDRLVVVLKDVWIDTRVQNLKRRLVNWISKEGTVHCRCHAPWPAYICKHEGQSYDDDAVAVDSKQDHYRELWKAQGSGEELTTPAGAGRGRLRGTSVHVAVRSLQRRCRPRARSRYVYVYR